MSDKFQLISFPRLWNFLFSLVFWEQPLPRRISRCGIASHVPSCAGLKSRLMHDVETFMCHHEENEKQTNKKAKKTPNQHSMAVPEEEMVCLWGTRSSEVAFQMSQEKMSAHTLKFFSFHTTFLIAHKSYSVVGSMLLKVIFYRYSGGGRYKPDYNILLNQFWWQWFFSR